MEKFVKAKSTNPSSMGWISRFEFGNKGNKRADGGRDNYKQGTITEVHGADGSETHYIFNTEGKLTEIHYIRGAQPQYGSNDGDSQMDLGNSAQNGSVIQAGVGINEHLVGPGLILAGQPINALKPVGALGSSSGSSIASKSLSKAIPQTFTKTLGKQAGTKIARTIGTNVIGRALGRSVPFVGWALTAYDAWDNQEIIGGFIEQIQSSNKQNGYKIDGSWNTVWHVH